MTTLTPEVKERIQKVIDFVKTEQPNKATGYLRTADNCYCILGCFAQVYINENPTSGYQWKHFEGDTAYTLGQRQHSLEKEILDWYEDVAYSIQLSYTDSETSEYVTYSLDVVNDLSDLSLVDIADKLQEYIKER